MIDIVNLRLFRVKRVYEELVLAEDEQMASEKLSEVMGDCNYEDQSVNEIRTLKELRHDFPQDTIPWGQKEDMDVKDFFEAKARAAWARRRAVHVVGPDDVGGGGSGMFSCLGQVQEQDVGKVIYLVDGIYQVENEAQREDRRKTTSDVQVRKMLLMEKLAAKQAEVNELMKEITGL